jgi:GntR family transcriptional regulator/MocR family aminotransferase
LAVLLEDGEVQRHIRRVRRIYQARRDLFAALLARAPRERLDFTVPEGGVALWVHLRRGSAEQWAERATARGVRFFTARTFAFDRRPRPFARLGFASHNDAELTLAVRRLIAALPE